MTRIAHLSDLHLDGTPERHRLFASALERAKQAHADHLVLTGDLTAEGKRSEFLELAQALASWPSHAVTLVPGNHDLSSDIPWREALATTPLGRFAHTSRATGCADKGDVLICSLDTQFPSRALLFRALGRVDEAQLGRLAAILQSERRPVVIAMHHGPQSHPFQFFEGLTNRRSVLSLLKAHPNASVLCGHDHRVLDHYPIYAAASVAHHPDPLRLYDVFPIPGSPGRLIPTYRSEEPGQYLPL